MEPDRLLLREYLRVSRDHSGEERSPNEQHDDHIEDAENQGFDLHPEPYRDIGSASRFKAKARDDFEQLLKDLRTDKFGADGLALWEGSRGSREIGDWATMLDLLAAGTKLVWLHTHERLYDPRKPRDRKTLLTEAVDAEYESGMTSVRNRRTARQQAKKGAPTGRCPYGYRRIYKVNPSGKRVIVAQVPEESEAPQIRELYARILRGDSIESIEADWSRRGIKTRSGKPFSHTHLSALAKTAAYGGWRVHAPGARSGRRTIDMDGATRVKGTWEALVDERVFLRVQEILRDPGRITWRPGGPRHLLAGIARCGKCGEKMTSTMPRGKEHYKCPAGHTVILECAMDEYVVSKLLEYLARDDLHAELLHGEESVADDLATVDNELATVEHDMSELRKKVKQRKLSLEFAADVEPALIADRDRLLARRRELTTPVRLRDLIEPGPDVAKRWEAASFGAKRAICRALFSVDWLGRIEVLPSPRRGRAAVLYPVDPMERVILARRTRGAVGGKEG